MTNTREQKTILVLGGTGKTGRRVVERLQASGAPVRVGSRSAAPPFDWSDRETWAPVLQDVSAVYVSYYPDLAVPGAPETVGAFTELAVASGASRLVLLSGRGEEEAEACEKLVQASGAEWTILRSSWFSQNFSEDYLLEPILGGEVVLPVGDVPEPFVDADDIADVAVAALTEDGHAGRLYELTGPRLLTFAEAVAEISSAAGRPIRFVQVSPEDYAHALAAENVPPEVAGLLTYLFTTVLDGRNAYLADGVQRALGRPPRDFTDYARTTAATGIWTPQHN
ncbi:NAD(P)H-binding protein [Sphaerisporangium rhizosphaerae]|uniref:NAD(P)H-binding protein n=1 Tax=Sphaerisporangium rhizosphaerae TaxID=2269375 RepID=A0ABW2NYB5_9ACTN